MAEALQNRGRLILLVRVQAAALIAGSVTCTLANPHLMCVLLLVVLSLVAWTSGVAHTRPGTARTVGGVGWLVWCVAVVVLLRVQRGMAPVIATTPGQFSVIVGVFTASAALGGAATWRMVASNDRFRPPPGPTNCHETDDR